MNRTKKITLKHKAKTKKAKPHNGNKPVYVSKAEREALAATEETEKQAHVSQDSNKEQSSQLGHSSGTEL